MAVQTTKQLRRKEAGRYATDDGTVTIFRDVSQQTYRADEICWVLTHDGAEYYRVFETLKEAKQFALGRGWL